MKINFQHIETKGFMSIGEGNFDISNQGYVLINGINKNPDDAAKSNGSGKCFARNTQVMMWDGTIKNIQDIKVNDIVMGWDSTPRVVLETHSGFGPLYKVTGNFGYDDYTYVCNENHILTLKKTCGEKKGEIIDISLKDYLLKSQNKWWKSTHNQFIMPITNYYHQETDLPIDPYFLGLWLGDGTSSNLSITTMDDEIKNYIYNYAQSLNLKIKVTSQKSNKARLYTITRPGKAYNKDYISLKKIFNDLNLLSVEKIKNKHIPQMFLSSSIENRYKLLAGLIDTDSWLQGTSNLGYYCITQKSDRLTQNILQLARSLGFKCSCKRYLNKKYNRYYNLISIRGEVWNIPVLLPRKKINKYKLQRPFTIKPTISYEGEGQYFGFSITGDGRFLLSNGLVVHNSSCIEAIVWALTGETVRGTKDVVNRYLNNGCKITLDFEIDNTKYKIIRTKDDEELGTNLKLYVNGEDKSGKGIRDTQHILEEYLPDLTPELIGSVIILGQGLPQRFTNNTPSGRKEVLEKLSKSDYMIEDIKDKLTKRKSELNDELRKYEDLILSNTSKKEILNNQLIKLQNDKSLLMVDVDYDSEIIKYEKQLNTLENSQVEAYNYAQQLNEKLNNKLKEYQDWTSKSNENFLYEKSFLEESLNPCLNKMTQLRTQLELKDKEIKRLESIVDICPTCGQHLPDVHKVDTTNLKKERENIIELLTDTENKYGSIKERVDKRIEELKKKFDEDTENIKKEGQELRQLYNEVSKQNEDYNKEINNIKLTIDKIKLNKETYEKQKETIDKEIEETQNTLNQISQEILYNNNDKDNIENHLAVVTKMLTFATRDFRGFLLSEIIKYINSKAKEYCMEIFETDKIEFILDGNNISISYCEKEYENLSGGEKQRIDLIVQFAIRDMLCQFMNFSSNLIALDEIFDALDSVACQNVINMLAKKLSDIESVFIISHHCDSLDIPYDKQMFIIKDEKGISRIE